MNAAVNAPTPDYRDVVAPIPVADIKEYFNNKNVFYRVNHTQSRVKGPTFLTYLANVNVPSDITFDQPISLEEYLLIMEAFLNQKMVSNSQVLNLMMAQVLLWCKGYELKDIPYKTDVPPEYIQKFAQANAETLYKWLCFVDSSQVFVLSAIPTLSEQHKPAETYPVIEDKLVVGHNVVSLFGVPHFTELYFGLKGAIYVESYYKHQFEEFMFANKKLEHYFNVPNNFIALVMTGLVDGTIDPNNLSAFVPQEPPNANGVPAPENG